MSYLTTAQIMTLLKVNRARVGQIAKRLGWQFEEIPSRRNVKAKRYLASDVEATVKVDGKWVRSSSPLPSIAKSRRTGSTRN